MTFDPLSAAGAMTREVRSGSRDGAATKIVIARRRYGTDRADLWDAITNPERIPRWFLQVSGDLRVGGRYQLEGNAGGVVERCEQQERFAITWEQGAMVSWLQVTLTPAGEETALELRHEAHVPPERWDQFGPGAVGIGWDLGLMGLERHLDSAAALDRAAGMAFPTTPEGAAFVRHAGDGWSSAAAADGEDLGQAQQAAARAVAFYTGATV